MLAKQNCWEFKKCGREARGAKARELGVCPAATEERLDGTHGGRMAGRSCWVVKGSLCGGEKQGSFAQKYGSCASCDFYNDVKETEYPNFELSITLLGKLRQ